MTETNVKVSLHGVEHNIVYKIKDKECVVRTVNIPKYAADHLFGFGPTAEDAIKNLVLNYDVLVDLATESEQDWWHQIYK